MLAEQERVQREQVVDLFRADLGRVLDIPRVDCVRAGAYLKRGGAGDQAAQKVEVAGAVDDEARRALCERADQEDDRGHRLAGAAHPVDKQQMIWVRRIERVQPLQGSSRKGVAERYAVGAPARGSTQGEGVADVAADVLAPASRHVTP